MSVPNRPVDPLYTCVTPIQYPNQEGHATGFFYVPDEESSESYLITNHHAVANDTGEPLSDSIRILLRPSQNANQLDFRDISLGSAADPNWLEHPNGPHVDVVAIELADIDLSDTVNSALHSGLFLPDDVLVNPGEEAMVIGYPFRGSSPYLPLTRSALISSPYGSTFQGMPCFATDANMHSGTSGSPVFTLPKPYDQTKDAIRMGGGGPYFLGIHSATLQSDHDPDEGPLNINLTWYAELLRDIIN